MKMPTLWTFALLFGSCQAWLSSPPPWMQLGARTRIIRWAAQSAEATDNVYSQPALYDLAFGYRSYDDEVDFLLTEHERYAGYPASTVLELMAGPARHSLSALDLDQVSRVVCVDNEPAMAEYAQQVLEEEIEDKEMRDKLEYQVADVRNVELSTKADTAWILLGSFQHMVRFGDAFDCLKAARKALNHDDDKSKQATLFLELPHPRELFQVTGCTRNEWTVPLDLSDGTQDELKILWGDTANDVFDPITQIRQHSVVMKLQSSGTSSPSVDTTVPLRSFTAPELHALAVLTGFEIAAWYGALEEGVEIDSEDLAFRMVCCLRTV